MQGDATVIQHLNAVLRNEMTAVNQYFLHARMLDHWGAVKLGAHEYEESIDEMKHADQLIARILYLEGIPNLQKLGKVNVGETVPEQLRLDLELERDAIRMLNAGIETARGLDDNGTRELLEHILEGEEHHANWIEAQMTLIAQTGEGNYLAQQIKKDE